jgi:hypothetical protein
MVANNSQMRPLQTEIHIIGYRGSGSCHHRTCFQRKLPKTKAPPLSRRRRSKPISMMRSNPMSETNETIIVGLVLSKLTRMQVFDSVDHVARSYGCQVSQAGLKQSKLKFHPY